MRRSFTILPALAPALAAVTLAGAALAQQSAGGSYRIAGIQAKLFYETKGTFSRDLLSGSKFTLWNTVIGEGDAEAPSNATLVLVEVQAKPGSYDDKRNVSLRATAENEVLVDRTVPLGVVGKDGKLFAAFWLYDTGCVPVKLTARLTGQKVAVTRTILFHCGE